MTRIRFTGAEASPWGDKLSFRFEVDGDRADVLVSRSSGAVTFPHAFSDTGSGFRQEGVDQLVRERATEEVARARATALWLQTARRR